MVVVVGRGRVGSKVGEVRWGWDDCTILDDSTRLAADMAALETQM